MDFAAILPLNNLKLQHQSDCNLGMGIALCGGNRAQKQGGLMTDDIIAKSTDQPQGCLTPGDRALLNAVFGWHMPGAACTSPIVQDGGKPVLIPLMAWVIADARRHGEVDGEMTQRQFTAAAAVVNRSPTPGLRLNAAQIQRGLQHLAAVEPLASAGLLSAYLNAGRATAVAG
jgi:hypothetical protein